MNADVMIVSPGSLEIPTMRGGGIQEIDYQIARRFPRNVKVLILGPYYRRYVGQIQLSEGAVIEQLRFPAVKEYPPRRIGKTHFLALLVYSVFASFKVVSMKRHSLKVVVVDYKLTGILPSAVSRLLRIGVIYSEGNNYPWEIPLATARINRLGWAINMFLGRAICTLSTKVRVLAPYFKVAMVRYGISPEKITVIPNGVDVDFFKPRAQEGRPFTIGFLGRMAEEKGAPLLREIILRCVSELPGAKFTILGSGPQAESVRALPNVQFCDSVPRWQLPEKIAMADVFVFFQHTFGLAELEVLSFGKPIITLDASDTQKYIVQGRNGFLVNPVVDDYVNVLRLLESNGALISEVGLNARQLAVREFSWASIAKKWAEFIIEVSRQETNKGR